MQEACYYLRKKGLTLAEISKALQITDSEAAGLYNEFEVKLAKGLVEENEVDRALWEDVYHDSIGDEKITFARDEGFYHCRKSDLEKMESSALMSVFESSRRFLDYDMYKRYLESKPPVGYDPMALQRQVKRAMNMIEQILKTRFERESIGERAQTE